jgi:hypothetical protein
MKTQTCTVSLNGSYLVEVKDAKVSRAVQELREKCEAYGWDLTACKVRLVVDPNMGLDEAIEDALSRFDAPERPDVKIYSFIQNWPSTALGFPGIGGSAITGANTTVVYSLWTGETCTYFNGRFAYYVCNPNELFWELLDEQNMPPIGQHHKLER